MDNFMDKLAKRFNAGEIIKANGAAEARDLKRMQEREAEYERMMQEMRRLNLKNVEVTEQVQQLIQCGIEQFEGYQSFDFSSLQETSMSTEQIEAKTAEISAEMERHNTKISESVEAQSAKISEIGIKLEDVERNLYSRLLQNEGEIAQALREIKDSMGDDNRLDAAFARLETAISTGRYTTENAITALKGDVDAMREIVSATQKSVDDGQRRLEDHVHKENVRVYRNVQAAVSDEISQQTRELNTRLDKIEKSSKKVTGATVFAVLTFLLVLADIALQVANLFHLI